MLQAADSSAKRRDVTRRHRASEPPAENPAHQFLTVWRATLPERCLAAAPPLPGEPSLRCRNRGSAVVPGQAGSFLGEARARGLPDWLWMRASLAGDPPLEVVVIVIDGERRAEIAGPTVHVLAEVHLIGAVGRQLPRFARDGPRVQPPWGRHPDGRGGEGHDLDGVH